MRPFLFSHRKATQVLNFFARQNGGEINKLKALKLVYFADRHHLRRYGRPITNDRYVAMTYGPVPSACKDLAEMSDFLGDEEREYASPFLETVDAHTFASKREPDILVLSESDLESLRFAWDTYQGWDKFKLAEHTHCFPEWRCHEAELASPTTSRVDMNYVDFLENPGPGVDVLPPLPEEMQADLREELGELNTIESLWR
ncbi:MAG: Panacea domain-containing protein [Kiritimatiellia bacterium]